MSEQFTWTPERIGHLCRRRFHDGALFKDIAREIGTTKSAVIGKWGRLLNEGHTLAIAAERVRYRSRMDEVADWMAAYGGSIADCARSLNVSYLTAKCAWDRVRRNLGPQAA